jgi:hypothetical protein
MLTIRWKELVSCGFRSELFLGWLDKLPWMEGRSEVQLSHKPRVVNRPFLRRILESHLCNHQHHYQYKIERPTKQVLGVESGNLPTSNLLKTVGTNL